MTTYAIVLAAGQGTRMKSSRPKVMHEMLGHPLVWWSVRAARLSGVDKIICVIGNGADEVRELFKDDSDIELVEQTERLGTGHAVQVALEHISDNSGMCVVLFGDTPLVEPQTITDLVQTLSQQHAHGAILTMTPPCVKGYGRISFDADGNLQAIIEEKDCTEQQRTQLTECNSGVCAFSLAELKEQICNLSCNNAQHEYYLTDMVALLKEAGYTTTYTHVDDYTEVLGVNSRSQLAQATKIMQLRLNERLMDNGVTILDPNLVWVDVDVVVEPDTTLLPMTFLSGNTHIGSNCIIGPNTRLTNTSVGEGCIVDETVALSAKLDNNVACGPRAYLRPGTHLLDGSKCGTHVEIKNSTIGKGSKVPHLSYIGDTTMGADVNVGAGSITCNYDGVHKHHTTIGDNVFIGSDTMLVAPVSIGDGALIGASSCITKDVPADALGIERSEQHIVKGYAQTRRTRLAHGKGTCND